MKLWARLIYRITFCRHHRQRPPPTIVIVIVIVIILPQRQSCSHYYMVPNRFAWWNRFRKIYFLPNLIWKLWPKINSSFPHAYIMNDIQICALLLCCFADMRSFWQYRILLLGCIRCKTLSLRVFLINIIYYIHIRINSVLLSQFTWNASIQSELFLKCKLSPQTKSHSHTRTNAEQTFNFIYSIFYVLIPSLAFGRCRLSFTICYIPK